MTPINALYQWPPDGAVIHTRVCHLESKQGAGGYIAHMSNICDSESRLQIHWRIREGGGGSEGWNPPFHMIFFF